jgi:hypothetical protein
MSGTASMGNLVTSKTPQPIRASVKMPIMSLFSTEN